MTDSLEDRQRRFVRQLTELGVIEEVRTLCRKWGVLNAGELYGPLRGHSHVAQARHEAMYFLRMRFKWSYPMIGSFFDRDHTTCMTAIRKIERRMNLNSIVEWVYERKEGDLTVYAESREEAARCLREDHGYDVDAARIKLRGRRLTDAIDRPSATVQGERELLTRMGVLK
jgi:hypothetical protein